MAKFNEDNERVKRDYLDYLRHAKGRDETTLDKAAAALREFEHATSFKNFKAFHRDWAGVFKRHLAKRRNDRTGQPLGVTTRDAKLRLVKDFVAWLASQRGFRSRVTYEDAASRSSQQGPGKSGRRRVRSKPTTDACGRF